MTLLLKKNDEQAKIDKSVIMRWWKWLDDNRGVRASLRRATSVDEVLLQQGFHQFLQFSYNQNTGEGEKRLEITLGEDWQKPNNWIAAALVCGLVAKVQEASNETVKSWPSGDAGVEQTDIKATFIQALAKPAASGGRPRLSLTRFSNLQRSRSEDEFFLNMSRAIDILGKKVPITSLAENILLWYHEFRFGPDSNPNKRLSVLWGGDYFSTHKQFENSYK